ncbi:hypothetical protein ACQP2P_11250 [Dactylosporangium sp. CA-139114]|uniref:hypothetical protein n=1 Tax=Dactylosporangium sp. CA-139114 TaxID=3239931 RepID=UPI003D9907DE
MGADSADIMRLVTELYTAHGKAEVAQAMAEATDDPQMRARHLSFLRYWDEAARALYDKLNATLDNAFTAEAAVETFLPVQPTQTGEVILRARDEQQRPVLVRLTAGQALTVGAHLTAYAATAIDRIGGKVADALPPIAAHAPFIPPAFIPRPGDTAQRLDPDEVATSRPPATPGTSTIRSSR